MIEITAESRAGANWSWSFRLEVSNLQRRTERRHERTSRPASSRRTKAPSQAEAAYRQLRDKLIMLEIRPGEPINDGQLAAELGFGRTPVREAIKRLEVDHLVVSYPRRGTFATNVDFTELADVSEIRELLEPLRGAPGRQRASAAHAPGTAARLPTTIAELDPSPAESRDLMRYDLTVHRLIYRAAANPHLEEHPDPLRQPGDTHLVPGPGQVAVRERPHHRTRGAAQGGRRG